MAAVPCALRLLMVLLVSMFLHTPSALAQDTSEAELARCADFGLDDAEVTARLHDVRARIEQHEPAMRHWVTAVGAIHGALVIGELVLAFTASGDGPRTEALIGAISGGLGFVTLLTSFPPLVGAGGSLDAMPEQTPEERLAKLVRAEEILRRSADSVSFVRGPIASLLSAGYVIVVSSLLATVFQRTTGAFVLAAGGVVLGQGRLLVHPDGILHEWRRYRLLHPDAGCEPASPAAAHASLGVGWQLGAAPFAGGGGIGFSLTF